jgi:superfamily I DNA and/or RNA helicase
MALRFIVEEELRTSNKPSILLTAYTNRAVDEICAMLCSLLPSLGKGLFLRIGNAASCDERYRPYLLDTALAGTSTLEEARSLIDSTPVIVSTTSMLLAQPFIMELKQFSLTIVDEASQILEPSLIGILSSEAVGRFVLVGDYKQLPAVVQQESGESIISEPCLQAIGMTDCRHSLFERLIGWEHRQRGAQFTGILHFHGRMHPDVASFPLQHFYAEERLCAVPLPHQQEKAIGYAPPSRDHLDRLLLTHRVLFIDTNEVNQEHHNSTLQEQVEARIVADLLQRIHRFTAPIFDASKTVGVIVPYRRQIALIRQQLHTLCPQLPAEEITIDTVERYQGSQRDVIIYSLGVSHRYQMDFITASTFIDSKGMPIDRKLNVALTRARRQTIVVGNGALLRHSPLYREFILRYK